MLAQGSKNYTVLQDTMISIKILCENRANPKNFAILRNYELVLEVWKNKRKDKKEEVMTKHRLIELTLALIILGVSFWNVKQQQETVSLRDSIVRINDTTKELRDKNKVLINENDHLLKQKKASSESLKKFQQKYIISEINTDLRTEFMNIITKLFEANLNFTPENYSDRKQEVTDYLTEELNKKYFGQDRRTYQETNDTISQLEYLEVYPKLLENNEISGLVIASYKSKKYGQDWIRGMNIFKVQYNDEIKKISKIINLGNGYSSYGK